MDRVLRQGPRGEGVPAPYRREVRGHAPCALRARSRRGPLRRRHPAVERHVPARRWFHHVPIGQRDRERRRPVRQSEAAGLPRYRGVRGHRRASHTVAGRSRSHRQAGRSDRQRLHRRAAARPRGRDGRPHRCVRAHTAMDQSARQVRHPCRTRDALVDRFHARLLELVPDHLDHASVQLPPRLPHPRSGVRSHWWTHHPDQRERARVPH